MLGVMIAYASNMTVGSVDWVNVNDNKNLNEMKIETESDTNQIECFETSFDLIFPCQATTGVKMHLFPKKFEFVVRLIIDKSKQFEKNDDNKDKQKNNCILVPKDNSIGWQCRVFENSVLKSYEPLLSKLNDDFEIETNKETNENNLLFNFANSIYFGQLINVCNYCYRLFVVSEILQRYCMYYMAREKEIEQRLRFAGKTRNNSEAFKKEILRTETPRVHLLPLHNPALYMPVQFFKLKRIDLLTPTQIELEFKIQSYIFS